MFPTSMIRWPNIAIVGPTLAQQNLLAGFKLIYVIHDPLAAGGGDLSEMRITLGGAALAVKFVTSLS